MARYLKSKIVILPYNITCLFSKISNLTDHWLCVFLGITQLKVKSLVSSKTWLGVLKTYYPEKYYTFLIDCKIDRASVVFDI